MMGYTGVSFMILAMVLMVVPPGCLQGVANDLGAPLVNGVNIKNPAFPADVHLRLNPDNGTILYLKGKDLFPNIVLDSTAGRKPESIAVSFIDHYKVQFRMDNPPDELRCLSVETDSLGLVHVRFQQIYKGMDVWGKEINVHLDQALHVNLVQGRYIPTPNRVDTTPGISATAAAKAASTAMGATQALAAPDVARMVIYAKPHGKGTLAYQVTLPGWIYFVDARGGTIIERIATRQTGRDVITPIKQQEFQPMK